MGRFQISTLQGPRLTRFRRLLVVVLVLFQAVTAIAIIGLSRLGTQQAMLEQAQHILGNATSESVVHTSAFLDSAQRTVSTAASLFAAGVVDAGDWKRLEQYFVGLLEHHDEFAGIYIGNALGEFLYVSRNPAGTPSYRIKQIVAGRPGAIIRYRDGSGAISAERHEAHDDYDPRLRPWYGSAVSEQRFVWTEPYTFFTDRKLGITAAVPVVDRNGVPFGALGIDLELEELAGFLDRLDISPSGSAFIASADGTLVAAPFARPAARAGGLPVRDARSKAGEAALDTVRTAFARQRASDSAGFEIDGRDYLVEFLPLALADGRRWMIGTYAPADEFLHAIRAHERNNIVIALAVLAASMVVGWFLAGTVWTPVALLHDQANRDQLTKVFNRRYVERHAPRLLGRARDTGDPISLVIVDIDRFKRINDTHGHGIGDEVIRETARRLRSAARIGDIVARIGGEEFLLVLPTANSEIAARIAAEILDWFRAHPIGTEAGDLQVTFSAGVATQSATVAGFEAVRAAADRALYTAKETGRNRIVVAAEPSVPVRHPDMVPDGATPALSDN